MAMFRAPWNIYLSAFSFSLSVGAKQARMEANEWRAERIAWKIQEERGVPSIAHALDRWRMLFIDFAIIAEGRNLSSPTHWWHKYFCKSRGASSRRASLSWEIFVRLFFQKFLFFFTFRGKERENFDHFGSVMSTFDPFALHLSKHSRIHVARAHKNVVMNLLNASLSEIHWRCFSNETARLMPSTWCLSFLLYIYATVYWKRMFLYARDISGISHRRVDTLARFVFAGA